jgi:hypothetical protein
MLGPFLGHELYSVSAGVSGHFGFSRIRHEPIQIYTCFSLHVLIYLSYNASASAQLIPVRLFGLEFNHFIPHSDRCCQLK